MAERGLVISLFDYSGNAVRDWAEAGYTCLCYDIQHDGSRIERIGAGEIHFRHADLNPDSVGWMAVASEVGLWTGRGVRPVMLFAWPPCDDLAVSGARHYARKLAADPMVQIRAAGRASRSEDLGRMLGCPYMIENPMGRLGKLWRRWDDIFDPYEFGGYLPEDDIHPRWPRHIAPRDAYTKRTGVWTGGGFVLPPRRPVQPEILESMTKSGRLIRGSRQFMLLGGSSHKTKTIRDETPRGLALAIFQHQHALLTSMEIAA